jgi:molybdopterin synthase catalytic subunit
MRKTKCLVAGPLPQTLAGEIMTTEGSGRDRGGISVFAGRVRDDIIGERKVKAIEYSAYEPMVEDEADAIIKLIINEYTDVKSVSILHSTGVVLAGELSLLVVVTAGHRVQAMQACSHCVELVKERLPVWKKELFEDESHRWV